MSQFHIMRPKINVTQTQSTKAITTQEIQNTYIQRKTIQKKKFIFTTVLLNFDNMIIKEVVET